MLVIQGQCRIAFDLVSQPRRYYPRNIQTGRIEELSPLIIETCIGGPLSPKLIIAAQANGMDPSGVAARHRDRCRRRGGSAYGQGTGRARSRRYVLRFVDCQTKRPKRCRVIGKLAAEDDA